MNNRPPNKFGYNVLKLTLSKVITSVVVLLNAMLLARFRTLEEYGTYSQLLLVVNLFTSIFMLGLPNSINYFSAKYVNRDERINFFSLFYLFTMFLSVLCGVVLAVCLPIIAGYFSNEKLIGYAYFLFLFPWTKITISTVDNLYIVFEKTSKLVVYKLLNTIIILFGIVIAYVLKMNFNSYLIMYLVTEICFSLCVYVSAYKFSGGFKLNVNFGQLKDILKFSLPIGLASTVGTINIELDKMMIGKYFTTQEMAVYSNASKEMPVSVVSSSVTALLLPKMARLFKNNEDKKAVTMWGHTTLLSFIIICFISSALFVFAEEVMTLFYSDKYLSGVGVFRVYSLVLLFRSTYFGMVLNSKGRTEFILCSSILSLITNVILNFICYRLFGFIGPAIATFIAIAITSIVQLCYSCKITAISITKIMPWRSIITVFLINLGVGIVFILIKTLAKIEMYTGAIGEAFILGAAMLVAYIIVMKKTIIREWKYLNENC